MASYDLVERLNNTFRQIELELQALQQALSDCRLLAGRVFELPAIGKDAEHDPMATIPVVQHIGKTARARPAPLQPSVYPAAIGKPQQQGRRTPAGGYLPAGYRRGAAGSAGAYSAYQCPEGHLREDRHRRLRPAPTARFEWVHRHLPGLITLSAYRTLTPLVDPSTIRFGWANKHVIKNLTRDQC